jgi:geranylgeranyl diphosphate synthase type II
MTAERPGLAAPEDRVLRDDMRRRVQAYCAGETLVSPLTLAEIEAHADRVLAAGDIEPRFKGFVSVLIGNEACRDTVAATPFERRILLLPQCLRSSTACRAESDALGLLCEECGRCAIGTLQREAEALGYVVLVAEGTTAVGALLTRGEADAVIGVSCLHALERSFGRMTAHAVPGLAVPLIRNGCVDTDVDLEWVREALHLRDPSRPAAGPDLQELRRDVAAWFEPPALRELLNVHGTATEAIAVEWMTKGGKRWRPLLAAGVYQALRDATPGPIPPALRSLAVAVECFHKASLVHDDIEDEDDLRYGEQTLHRQHGMAVALNVGDLLIGEGYRLIAESGAIPADVREMTAVAAGGHRTLCLGQGEELLLRRMPDRVTAEAVIDIFRRKTAPAFEVALQLGAIAAGADRETRAVLGAFSGALGVAYQIRDDLEDQAADGAAAGLSPRRPSLLLALARGGLADPSGTETEEGRYARAEALTREQLRHYEEATLQALSPLKQAALKRLLHRVAALILRPSAP